MSALGTAESVFNFVATFGIDPIRHEPLVLRAKRADLINELGTGGLLGPVGIYREK